MPFYIACSSFVPPTFFSYRDSIQAGLYRSMSHLPVSQPPRPPESFHLTNEPNPRFPSVSSTDPHLSPFWHHRLVPEYDRHLLPTNSQPVKHRPSWFSINHFSSLSPCASPIQYDFSDQTVTANAKHPPKVVKKIRIYPDSRQKKTLNKMAGTARVLYNRVTSMIRDQIVPFDTKNAYLATQQARSRSHVDSGKAGVYKETAYPWFNFQYMRNFLVNNQSAFVTQHPWMKETPNSVRQIAVQEGIANYKAALSNLKAGNIRRFETPFRRKKNRAWSIGFDPTQLKNNRLLPGGDFGYLRVAEPTFLRGRYQNQFRITRDKYFRYHIVLFPDVLCPNKQEAPESSELPIIAIDPGIRTRHTLYSTSEGGRVTEIGSGDIQRVIRIAKFVDKKISASHQDDCNHKQRRRLLKQRLKLTARIADLKKEMDYQTIGYLERNASLVLFPSFDVHSMACRLRHKTARSLLCWGHGLFKQRLLERARHRPLHVMVVSEHYTSKTCGGCGRLHETLGGKKTYACPSCGFEADRDHNGARNILLRALRKN